MNTKQFILDRLAEGKSRESIAQSLGMTEAKLNRRIGNSPKTRTRPPLLNREKLVKELVLAGKTYVEIASTLGMKYNAVVAIVSRMRKKKIAVPTVTRPHVARMRAATELMQAEDEADPPVKMSDLMPVPELCPMLGIPIGRPMMARLDPRKGFTRSNTVLVSEDAGDVMGKLTPEQLAKVALAVIAAVKSRSTPA